MDFFKLISDLDDQPSVSDTKPQSSGDVSDGDFVASTSTSVTDKNAFHALDGVDGNDPNIFEDSLKRKRELTPEVSTAEDESIINSGSKQHDSDKFLPKKKAKLEVVETPKMVQVSTSKVNLDIAEAPETAQPSTSKAQGDSEGELEDENVQFYYQKSDAYRNLIKQTIEEMPEWRTPLLHSLEKDLNLNLDAQNGPESVEAMPKQRKSNVKDKRCQFCSISCASVQSLLRHIERKHPGQKGQWSQTYVQEGEVANQIACPKCSKTFATVESLRYHDKRTHAQNLPFACTVCGKKYPIASELRKHQRRVHKLV